MTEKIRILFIALLVVLVSCLGIGSAFSKYITNIELKSFNLKINVEFSGIVSTNEELKFAKDEEKWGNDYRVVDGGETYTIVIGANGVNVIVDNAVMNVGTANAFNVSNNGTITINNANETSNPNRAALATVNNGGTLIINGGTYSASSIAMGNSTGTVKINGGTFHVTALNGMSGMGYMMVGTFEIRGGTFSIDPSIYVVEGYEAVNNGNGTWTVVCSHPVLVSCTPDPNHTTHSGTCEQCGEATNETHTLDENGLCSVCGYKTIVNTPQIAEAVENGKGTPENPVEIAGGSWTSADVWTEWNPDRSKRLTLNIYSGEFNDWLMYVTNSDVTIYGGIFKTDCFFMDGATTITICGGDWTAIDSFTFTEDANANIKGGIFGFDVTKWVRTEGYECVGNGDGTWTVRQSI